MNRPTLGLLMAFALALLLLEGLLRVVHVPEIEIHRRAPARAEGASFSTYDPELGWRGRPKAQGSFAGWEFTSDVRLNAQGFRDVEVDEAKLPGVLRIVLLGDSITWGHGVEQAQRYGDLLTEALRRRAVTAQVVNLAVSGYGTDQELLLWEREGRRYCADLVLLGLYENDVRENALAFQGRYPKPYFRLSRDGALILHNVPVPRVPETPPPSRRALRTWLHRHVRLWAALAFAREALRGADQSPTAGPEMPPGSVELTAALIRRLAASVRGEESTFAIVVLPDLYYAGAMMKAASQSGVATILDLAQRFRAVSVESGPLFYRLDGAHWTPRAHEVAAESIAQWMMRDRLLPRSPRACARSS
jgi:hypothetical protein